MSEIKEINWKEIVDKLVPLLKLGTVPVAMKWIRTEEELQGIPKIRIQEKHFPPCVIVGQAAQLGWTTACRAENIHADYCRGINGMFQRDDKWFSGGIFDQVWFDNSGAAAAHNQGLDCVPPEYMAVAASPLASMRIEPDVVVLYLLPTQAFLLLSGLQVHDYERFNFSFSGESTCSDSWCKTFITGKPGLGLPCYADKKFAAVGDSEVRVTLTPSDLIKAVEGLEKLSKNGLRYPIASYSLTTDILEGLPPSYLEY